MRPISRPFALLILALVPTSSALASPPIKDGVWKVDYGEQRCTLVRSIPGPPERAMAIQVIPESERSTLIVTDAAWTADPLRGADSIEVQFLPAKVVVRVPAASLVKNGAQVVAADLPDEPILDTLAQAEEVRIMKQGVVVEDVPLTASASAVQALRTCNRDLMKSWGVDPAQIDALKRPPVGEPGSFYHPDDYPGTSLTLGHSGTAVLRYVVAPNGHVSSCDVVVSTGDLRLDRASCDILKMRGRFEPALDQAGNPVEATMITHLLWNVPH